MKNQKTLLITVVLFLALISLSCTAALRPTYPGYTGGYGLARQAKAPRIVKKPRVQIKELKEQIRDLKKRNRKLAAKKTAVANAKIKQNKMKISKYKAQIKMLQKPRKRPAPVKQQKPRPKQNPRMQTRN